MREKKQFMPAWLNRAPEKGSFRSIMKWGAPDEFKNPSPGFLNVIKQELGLDDSNFKKKQKPGEEKVKDCQASMISESNIRLFEDIVGKENLAVDTYERLKYSSGKSMEDIFKLRENIIDKISDLVLHTRDKKDVKNIIALCNDKKIPVHIYSGGSSVTFGLNCPKGGVTLVMSNHMNKMISFSEKNQTITVEPGMMGPFYEDLLNNAPEKLGTKKKIYWRTFPPVI